MIELLEPRIAPAAVVTFTDVDGDAVTVTSSKGTKTQLEAALRLTPAGLGHRIDLIDLSAEPFVFHGTNLSITAVPGPGGGNDAVNVLRINATKDGDFWIGLGKITVDGALGEIDSLAYPVKGALSIASLTARSIGSFGVSPAVGDGDGMSNLAQVGTILVTEDFTGSIAAHSIKQLIIKGELDGTRGGPTGRISVLQGIAKLEVAGGINQGAIHLDGVLGSGKIGAIIGGGADFSGFLWAKGGIGSLVVNGSVTGGAGRHSGEVISGNLTAVLEEVPAIPLVPVKTGKVVIAGNVTGASGGHSGRVELLGSTASLTIAGLVQAGSGDFSGSIYLGAPPSSGPAITVGSLTLGGILGGTGGYSEAGPGNGLYFSHSQVFVEGSLKKLAVTGTITHGDGIDSGRLVVMRSLGAASLASMDGGTILADTMGTVKVTGDVAGSVAHPATIGAQRQIKSVEIGGSFIFGQILVGTLAETYGELSNDAQYFGPFADVSLGSVLVKQNWQGSSIAVGVEDVNTDGFGNSDDAIVDIFPDLPLVVASIRSVTIKGAVQTTAEVADRFGIVAQVIGSVRIGPALLPLQPGPANDLTPVPAGPGADLFIREVPF